MDVKNEIRRAAQLQKQGQTAQSLQRFRAIARRYPEQIVPWLAIAALSRDQPERQKAMTLALRLQPQNEIALRLRRKLGAGPYLTHSARFVIWRFCWKRPFAPTASSICSSSKLHRNMSRM